MVGACIGTVLLYTVVLLVVIFTVALWNRTHRSVLVDVRSIHEEIALKGLRWAKCIYIYMTASYT